MKQMALFLVVLTALVSACSQRFDHGGRSGQPGDTDSGGDTDSDSDTDVDSDSDTDTDTDSDSDSDVDDCGANGNCSACGDPACICAIAGHVEDQDGTPLPDTIQICVPMCMTAEIDANGDFCHEFDPCMGFDFEEGSELHITVFQHESDHTRYSVAYEPTQAEIADNGDDDCTFDVGVLKQYELPATGAQYTHTTGVTVADQDGVSFDLGPDALDCQACEEGCTVKVMEFPIDEWMPPFIPEGLEVDALYYLHPYLCYAEGLELHIDPAAAGWSGTDTGTVHMLGDYSYHDFNCGGDDLPVGVVESCAGAAMQGDEIVTEALPVLGWVALVKD
jgi:hypothetical protein